MKAFISWSGQKSRSHALAALVEALLNSVTSSVEVFLSDNIRPGTRWSKALRDEVAGAGCAIFCLTPESISSPWMLFETGALAACLGHQNLIPLRLGLMESSVPEPLKEYQGLAADRTGFLELCKSVNALLPARGRAKERDLELRFEKEWSATSAGQLVAIEALPPLRQGFIRCNEATDCLASCSSDKRWSNQLEQEVHRFARLPYNNPETRFEVSESEYSTKAQECRERERQSIHVLYATLDSILNYYSQVNEQWVASEARPSDLASRRRILVVEAAAGGEEKYRGLMARIYQRLSRTSTLRVFGDDRLVGEHSRMLRDIGVFTIDNGDRLGLAPFAQMGTKRVFCQSPGSYFVVRDQGYLDDVTRRFDALWDDQTLSIHRQKCEDDVKKWARDIDQTLQRWARAETALNGPALGALFENEIPAIRIQNFASPEECGRFLKALERFHSDAYTLGRSDPSIGKVGTPLFEYRNNPDKSQYFTKARESQAQYDAVCKEAGWDPVARMQRHLEERCRIRAPLASEDPHGKFFAGVVRFIEKGALCHVDFAPADAIGYAVDKVLTQVAWNLVLTAPDTGGSCRVFRVAWNAGYEALRHDDSYGFDQDLVVPGAQHFDIQSIQGDVVLFNCRNFHDVCASSGERVTVGSFLGKFPGNRYVVWS